MVMERGHGELFNAVERYHQKQIPQQKPNAWKQIVKRWAWQLMTGVAFMHRHRICHRDLSLENALLTAEKPNGIPGDIKIMDFGVATEYDTATGFKQPNYDASGTVKWVGKKQYMSPELWCHGSQNRHIVTDPRKDDIWAIGVMIFAMTSGAPPWDIADPHADRRVKYVYTDHNLTRLIKLWNLDTLFSTELIHLLQYCIFAPEAQRWIPERALRHPYFSASEINDALRPNSPRLTKKRLQELLGFITCHKQVAQQLTQLTVQREQLNGRRVDPRAHLQRMQLEIQQKERALHQKATASGLWHCSSCQQWNGPQQTVCKNCRAPRPT